MIKVLEEKHIPKTVTEDDKEFIRGRWITLTDSEGNLKAESSSDDLLQFYEEGDRIYMQYIRTESKYFDNTEAFLKDYSVEEWKDLD